jgi:hypothetical protein
MNRDHISHLSHSRPYAIHQRLFLRRYPGMASPMGWNGTSCTRIHSDDKRLFKNTAQSTNRELNFSSQVQSAGSEGRRIEKAPTFVKRTRVGRLQQELPTPRLQRESGGGSPTLQMPQVIGRKRAEVQGSAPIIEGRGRRPTLFQSQGDFDLRVMASGRGSITLPCRRGSCGRDRAGSRVERCVREYTARVPNAGTTQRKAVVGPGCLNRTLGPSSPVNLDGANCRSRTRAPARPVHKIFSSPAGRPARHAHPPLCLVGFLLPSRRCPGGRAA